MTRADLGPPTAAAIDAAQGDRKAAARALGISVVALYDRVNTCHVPRRGGPERLYDWLQRAWPQRGGHRSVDVMRVDYEGTGDARQRVYVLAAHGDAAEGEHVNRVPAVGKVRGRVVCKVCREKRSEER